MYTFHGQISATSDNSPNSGPLRLGPAVWMLYLAEFRSTFQGVKMYLKLFITIVCSSTLYVYSDVTFSPARSISWLHQPCLLHTNTLNVSCGILASKITGLFLDQYQLHHLLDLLAGGNSRHLLPRGCYWQMCHTHYPFYPPVCYFSGNIQTFPTGEIQDNRTCFPLNSTVASNIVRANSACFTSVKEPLYAAMMSY